LTTAQARAAGARPKLQHPADRADRAAAFFEQPVVHRGGAQKHRVAYRAKIPFGAAQ
jgi:hypothetical protein